MNLNYLKTGDIIVRTKGIFSTHFMIFIGHQQGKVIVAENQVGHGVRYATLDDALNGNQIIRTEKFMGLEHERNNVIPRVNSILGKSYNLTKFNCEHFARFIAEGKARSRQIRIGSNLLLVAGLGLIGNKNKALRNIGYVSLITGLTCKLVQQ